MTPWLYPNMASPSEARAEDAIKSGLPMSHFGYRAVYVLGRKRIRSDRRDDMVVSIQRQNEHSFMKVFGKASVRHDFVLGLGSNDCQPHERPGKPHSDGRWFEP